MSIEVVLFVVFVAFMLGVVIGIFAPVVAMHVLSLGKIDLSDIEEKEKSDA